MAAFRGCNRNMDLDLTSNKCKPTAIAETREKDQAMNAFSILTWIIKAILKASSQTKKNILSAQ